MELLSHLSVSCSLRGWVGGQQAHLSSGPLSFAEGSSTASLCGVPPALGRKVMTNQDSILKSRDITLPTKVCLVKAMVFPVVMYGCESWTVKKAER